MLQPASQLTAASTISALFFRSYGRKRRSVASLRPVSRGPAGQALNQGTTPLLASEPDERERVIARGVERAEGRLYGRERAPGFDQENVLSTGAFAQPAQRGSGDALWTRERVYPERLAECRPYDGRPLDSL
ncbi:MAG: hypothetical protein MUF34_08065 [Polyangiaceae bacterium]|nr:hypothetical protein [Polyangiaceae bacterium]